MKPERYAVLFARRTGRYGKLPDYQLVAVFAELESAEKWASKLNGIFMITEFDPNSGYTMRIVVQQF